MSVDALVPEFQERAYSDDWSFTSHEADALSSLHPYPAKFISAIPAKLLQMFPPQQGTAVFDPFCGSGTTLLEAKRNNYPSVGVDLNPIATLISRVKVGPRPSAILSIAKDLVEKAKADRNPEIPKIPNLDHWFKSDVQKSVAALSNAIKDANTEAIDCLRLALSSILVRVSNQDSDTRYAAVDKKVQGDDVFAHFIRSVEKIDAALCSRSVSQARSRVIEGDILSVSASQVGESVGTMITSPPYPNAYEYWLYHKYRMWWLGFDPLAVKDREIGARAHFFGKHRHDETNFVVQMRATLKLVRETLVPGGHACFIVGRSKIHGKLIDNGEIIKTEAEKLDFECVLKEERLMSTTKKSFNLSHANIKTETVLVLRG